MRLGEPWALALLVLAPLVLVLHVVLERRRARRIGAAGDASLIGALVLAEADGGKTIRLARAILLSIALLFAVLALARPQFGMRTEMRKGRGIDLVVALDLSKSMLARDVVPSRLDRARLEIEEMVKQLAGDRIGLVGFTSMALPLCPLTVDHSALRLQLRSADPADFPRGGTAITEAITAAQQMLDSSKKTGAAQAILLITDGEENEGDPAAAATKAKEAGIEVHVAGVGSRTGEPIPLVKDDGTMDGYLKDAQGQTVISRLDEATLRKVADAGGGKLALPSDIGGLDLSSVRAHLATLKRAELEDRVVRVYEERYQWALVPAVLALFAATFLRSTRRRARLVVRGLGASALGPSVLLLA
ncbi:VWA domain-containing protein, partial [Myxococcota bacterium]|nr:VWA domain-containing protein [Myxococcota bacterium]